MRLFQNKNTKWIAATFVFFTFFASAVSAITPELNASNSEVRQFAEQMKTQYRYNPTYIYQVLGSAHIIHHARHSVKHPFEEEPWFKYRDFFVTSERIDGGVNFYDHYNKVLGMEKDYFGVPTHVIVSIMGVETRYGERMGDYRVLDTLATLSFNHSSPREKYFRRELRDFFLLVREKNLNPYTLKGSYAGAMGMPQFMPSSYLYYGYGFANEKQVDLFNSRSDAIFSIGNYLMQKGWERDQPIAVRAKITGHAYKSVLKRESRKVHIPEMNLQQLARYGVTPAEGKYSPYLKAYLMELEGTEGQPEYWLGFHNFYVITLYNNSDLYAMAVHTLGGRIQQGWEQKLAAREAKKIVHVTTHKNEKEIIG